MPDCQGPARTVPRLPVAAPRPPPRRPPPIQTPAVPRAASTPRAPHDIPGRIANPPRSPSDEVIHSNPGAAPSPGPTRRPPGSTLPPAPPTPTPPSATLPTPAESRPARSLPEACAALPPAAPPPVAQAAPPSAPWRRSSTHPKLPVAATINGARRLNDLQFGGTCIVVVIVRADRTHPVDESIDQQERTVPRRKQQHADRPPDLARQLRHQSEQRYPQQDSRAERHHRARPLPQPGQARSRARRQAVPQR